MARPDPSISAAALATSPFSEINLNSLTHAPNGPNGPKRIVANPFDALPPTKLDLAPESYCSTFIGDALCFSP